MLTEFEVRRELDLIQGSDASPRVKARKLIRLGKNLKSQTNSLVAAHKVAARNKNGSGYRQFERLAQHSRILREEVRSIALSLLRSNSRYRSNVGGW